MKRLISLLLFLLFCFFLAFPQSAKSQTKRYKANKSITIKSLTSKTNIHIGDVFDFTIVVKYHKDLHVQPPPLGESLGDFEVIDNQFDLPSYSKNYVYRHFTYRLSIYQIGSFKIPALVIKSIHNETQKITTTSSAPIKVKVMSLTKDEEQQIAPIDLSIEVSSGRVNYGLIVSIVIVLLLMIVGIAFLIWYQKNKKIPYYIKLLTKMDKLEKRYLQQEEVETEFYFVLYQFMVEHLSEGENIISSSMTLRQMKKKIQLSRLPKNEFFLDFFVYAEKIKFAKLLPEREKSIIYYNTFKQVLKDKQKIKEQENKQILNKNKKKKSNKT